MHLLAREETGLRCLLQVARCGAPGRPVPIAQIAGEEGISGMYAAKLMRQLRLAGLVDSTRGAAGGYLLSRPAASITVWDAIHALDESFLPELPCECEPADRVDCRRTTTCAVSSLWRRLGDEIRRSLESVTLSELCEGALERPHRVELPIVAKVSSRPGLTGKAGDRNAGDPERMEGGQVPDPNIARDKIRARQKRSVA